MTVLKMQMHAYLCPHIAVIHLVVLAGHVKHGLTANVVCAI